MKATNVKNEQRPLLRACKELARKSVTITPFARDSKAGRGVKKLFIEIKGRFQGVP